MTRSAVFSQMLCQGRSAADLLKLLAPLPHVVYLQDVDQPMIACFAQRYLLAQHQQLLGYQLDQEKPTVVEDVTEWLSFQHPQDKLVGFISYDYAAQQHIELESSAAQPQLFLGMFDSYLYLQEDCWYFQSHSAQAKQYFQQLQTLLNTPAQPQQFYLTQSCQARWSFEQYQHAFQQVQDYIVAGDCYQINLTQQFIGTAQGDLAQVADAFWQLTQAPYAGYARIAEFELLSCSPELFIEFQDNRRIITKPIKGTMPRYADPELDQQSKQTLAQSEKDRAENVMIVDLLRNDLSVYAETGSVKTPKLFAIESFKQVHHMVSDVTATLKAEVNPLAMLLHALPGGSITGAPKIRAMQIIDELEGAPRGAYCGSMGYFNADGTGAWNILIRSIQKQQQHVSIWAGGGITIASNCEAEYQECFDKVAALLDLLNRFTSSN